MKYLLCGILGIILGFLVFYLLFGIALHCWKAKAENIIKIKQGYREETKDMPVDLNNITV